MRLLAVDTSSDACSVALRVGDDVYADHVVRPRQHTALLMPMIGAVVREAGIELTALDALVLGNGPGSFIGMRIAASVAQGVCFGAGLRIVPVSSLAAVAAETMQGDDATDVVVAQDARMNEVYLGCYRRGGDGLPVAASEEALQQVGPLDLPGAADAVAAGLGFERYPQLLATNTGLRRRADPVLRPNARFLLGLGARDLRRQHDIAPEALVPAYLRMKVAAVPGSAP